MHQKLLVPILLFSMLISMALANETAPSFQLKNMKKGMPKNKLLRYYPMEKARSYRTDKNQEWITYNFSGTAHDTLTFTLTDSKVTDWKINDRQEVVAEYLSEFTSSGILFSYPNIHAALKNALNKLPQEVFWEVTHRSRPIIFMDYLTSGIGRFANSTEFFMRPHDPPAFAQGFYMIKLSDEVENASPEEIEGLILHEIAHRTLEHLHSKKISCDMEREANMLVKSWGFEQEFLKAKERFGSKEKGDSPCQDE